MRIHRSTHDGKTIGAPAGAAVATLGLALGVCGAASAAPERWVPAQGDSWWWQLENAADVDVSRDVDVFDIDLFEGIESGKIAELKEAGKRVICYFSAGTYEPWRDDAARFTAEALIDGAALPQFDEETWLDLGDGNAVRDIIKPIMRQRLHRAKRAGCDAVEPDNVDGFANEETGGAIGYRDQLRYNRWLARAGHARGLSVGLKNNLEQVDDLAPHFDFAVSEQCYGYDNECVSYGPTFLEAGKAVFNQEYGGGGDEGDVTLEDYRDSACPQFLAWQVSSLWKRTLQLDGQGVEVCAPD